MLRKLVHSEPQEKIEDPINHGLVLSRLSSNKLGKDFVIGDLHGHYDELMLLLETVEFDKNKDRLFATGDLTDRGNKNMECLSLLSEPWFFSARGNHEDFLIQYAENGKTRKLEKWLEKDAVWLKATPLGYLKKKLSTLLKLPHVIIVGDNENRFHIVHAELMSESGGHMSNEWIDCLETGMDLVDQQKRFMWGRTLIRQSPGEWRNFIDVDLAVTFCGHSVVKSPISRGKHVFIDSGVFLPNGGLNIVDISEEIYFKAKGSEIISSGRIEWEMEVEEIEWRGLADVPF